MSKYCLLLLLLLAGCGRPMTVDSLRTQGGEPLTPEAIVKLVEGNTLHVESIHEDARIYFADSGRLFAKDINNSKDRGRWDVSTEAELCLKYDKWWFSDLRCFTVMQDGERLRLFRQDGGLEMSATLLQGDTAKLFEPGRGKRESVRGSAREEQAESVSQTTAGGRESAREKTPTVEDEQSAPAASAAPAEENTVRWMARECPGCNLRDADLSGADLVIANLAGADLKGANLKGANLRRANLQDAKLEGADLSIANLPGANLKGADLRGANLTRANLTRADLTDAKLDGAILTDAILQAVIGMEANGH